MDAFIGYRTKLWNNKVGASFQLNIRNLGERGRLQPIAADPHGAITAYRIVSPQQFILTASFDLYDSHRRIPRASKLFNHGWHGWHGYDSIGSIAGFHP